MRLSILAPLVVCLSLGGAVRVSASDAGTSDLPPPAMLVHVADLTASHFDNGPAAWHIDRALVPNLIVRLPAVRPVSNLSPMTGRRPAALLPLYTLFGALQVADLVSTERALAGGSAREANPVVAPFSTNVGAMLAVKAGSTAATILLAERLWRKDRFAAVVLMAGVDCAYAVIAAHNFKAGQ